MNATIEDPSFTRSLSDPKLQPPAVGLGAKSRLGLSLRRGAAAGLRVIVLAPHDPAQTGAHFPERAIRPDAHIFWETGRRLFLRAATTASDRGSWHILVADRDGVVVGTISARFFRDPPPSSHLRVLALAEAAGPIFREQCELAMKESHDSACGAGKMFGEISDWAVASSPHRRLITVMLVRAMAALAAGFENPLCVLAANQFRNEVTPLLQRGAAPLGRAGKFCLPPLIDAKTSSWVRILLLDTTTFHARSGTKPIAELTLLRRRAAIVGVA